jgi:photosystem II stability/assembly factor-like uncharacterized protein
MRKSSLLCFAVALLLPQWLLAGSGFWTSTGPHGGRVLAMQIDPTDPATIYVSSRGGVFKSIDGGASWNRAQNGLAGSGSNEPRLLMDRERPARLYLVDASGRLMRTTDGGANWVATGYDVLAAGIGVLGFADVPTPARNGEFYFAAIGGTTGTGSGIYKTTDDGATFSRLGGGLPPRSVEMAVVAVDPDQPQRVFAGIGFFQGPAGSAPPAPLYRSTDGGANWTPVIAPPVFPVDQPVFADGVSDLAFGPGALVYALYQFQLYRSTDDGATWALVAVSLPQDTEVVEAHPTLPGTVYVGAGSGFYTVTGADGTSPVLSAASTTLTPNPGFTDAAVPPRPIQTSAQQIVLAPNFPAGGSAIWVLTEYAGLFRSLDGGASFSSFGVNDGLLATNPRAVVVHPTASPTRIYAGLGDSNTVTPALWRSDNNGVTWPTANSGLRAGQIRALAIDPTTTINPATGLPSLSGTVVYAGGRGVLFGPQALPPGNLSSGRNGGLYKSANGGSSWTTLDGGLPTSTSSGATFANLGLVRAIVLDPRACASGAPPGPSGTPCTPATGPLQRVFASASGFQASIAGTPPTRQFTHRIVVSNDAGGTWADASATLPASINQLIDSDGPGPNVGFNRLAEFVTPVPLVMDPTDSNVLYVGTFLQQSFLTPDGNDRLEPQPTPITPNGVFKSTDGGVTWQHRSIGLPRYPGSTVSAHDVLALGISGRNRDVLWAATAVNQLDRSNTSLYRSDDGGDTWTEARAGIAPGLDIRAITVNTPTDPGLNEVVYVAGAGTAANPGAVYRSTDNGATWASISIGLPADAALAITTEGNSATARRRVIAGTNLGVWELTQLSDVDLDGAPDANEINAPNGGDGNNDGQLDSTQGDVGSTIVLDRAPAQRGFLTCDGQFTSEIINDAQCPQARDVQQVDDADLPVDPIAGGNGRAQRYPLDLARFEIPQCQQATVEITFHLAGFLPALCPDFNDFQWSFRFYGPRVPGDSSTIGWYDLGNRATRVGPKKWRLTLDAGQFGSYRPNDPANPSNNSILFIGGPALSGDRVFRSGFEPGGN